MEKGREGSEKAAETKSEKKSRGVRKNRQRVSRLAAAMEHGHSLSLTPFQKSPPAVPFFQLTKSSQAYDT